VDIDFSVAVSGPEQTESSLRTFGVSWGLTMEVNPGSSFICNPSSLEAPIISLAFTPYKSGPNDTSVLAIGDDNLYGTNGDGGSASEEFRYAFDIVWDLIPYLGTLPSPSELASDTSVSYSRSSVYDTNDRVDFEFPSVFAIGGSDKSATGGAHFSVNLADSDSVDYGEFGFQVYATADIYHEYSGQIDSLLVQDTFTVDYVDEV